MNPNSQSLRPRAGGSPAGSPRVVVAGAGVAGLMVALALARQGAAVNVLERDALPHGSSVGGDADTAAVATWRKGVPQARHTHACAALGRRLLREHMPEVWAALLDAGAVEMPLGADLGPAAPVPRCSDPELFGLSVRRSLFEDVLRRAVRAQRQVRLRAGVTVTGLLVCAGTVPEVQGVRTSAGDVEADLTIDALGRASPLGKWLREAGAAAPEDAIESCGLEYLTRWYRVLRRPEARLTAGLSAGGYAPSSGCIVCPADHHFASITLMTPHGDKALRPLNTPAAFTAAARLHAGIAPWLEPGACEPLTPVQRWPGCENRFRRQVVAGRPVVLGLLGVGDSICITNPTYTRGISLAIRHSLAIADLVGRDGLADLQSLAMHADAAAQALLRPWFDDSVAQDRVRAALWQGRQGGLDGGGAGPTLQDIAAAARHDDLVWHALARRSSLLDEPTAIFAHGEVLARARVVLAQRPAPTASGPTREDLLRVISTHGGPSTALPHAQHLA